MDGKDRRPCFGRIDVNGLDEEGAPSGRIPVMVY